MPLDPAARAFLDEAEALGAPPTYALTPAEARAARPLPPPGPEVARVEDMEVFGPEGPIPVRLYYPSDAPNLPVLIWFHGGGWVLGSVEHDDPTARRLCAGSGVIVISVDYRLAPENRYPAAVDDAYAAAVWAWQNAARYGGDQARIAVGGVSAGANLAAAVTLLSRDRGGTAFRHQLLVVPVTDCRMQTASYAENADGYVLTRASMEWFYGHYAPAGVDRAQPSISPLLAKSHAGLPPADIHVAEYDPLRDEGEAYAAALEAAGVLVTLTRHAGQIHSFFTMAHLFPEGLETVRVAAERLRKALE
ncbi:MAG: alpha/beta hydrolase [Dehalococcoidia bacterium]|nr:MAG: alpha/beta hydrolase [Dehalococcoidia bacterium]